MSSFALSGAAVVSAPLLGWEVLHSLSHPTHCEAATDNSRLTHTWVQHTTLLPDPTHVWQCSLFQELNASFFFKVLEQDVEGTSVVVKQEQLAQLHEVHVHSQAAGG